MRLTLAGAVATAALALAVSAGAANRYCSPTGDYCTSTAREAGAVFLQLRTFSFQSKVRICVTDPRRRQTCYSFLPRPRPNGVFELKVRWHRTYPYGGKGTYRVRFSLGGTRLGPVLTFRLR